MAGEGYLPPVIARLTMNIDEFIAQMATAMEAMQELAARGVDVPVNLDLEEAEAQLTQLGAIEGALRKTSQGVTDQLRLQEAAIVDKAGKASVLARSLRRVVDEEIALVELSGRARDGLEEQAAVIDRLATEAAKAAAAEGVLAGVADKASAALEKQSATTKDKQQRLEEMADAAEAAASYEAHLRDRAEEAGIALEDQGEKTSVKARRLLEMIEAAEAAAEAERQLSDLAVAAGINLEQQGRKSMTKAAQMKLLAAQLADTSDEEERLAIVAAAAALAMDKQTNAANRNHGLPGWAGLLGNQVSLFGGLLGDTHLIGQIQLWHILLDGLIETFIAFGSALTDLTITGVAFAPAVEAIAVRLGNMEQASSALGVKLPNLSDSFQQLSRSVAPNVVEAFGAILRLMSGGNGDMARMVHDVAIGIDDWLAKLEIFEKTASGGGIWFKDGLAFLHQFEELADEAGVALGNLIKADPGTAHYLMDIVVAVGKVFDAFTELPTPILLAVLALHSFSLWGGLLTSWALKFLTPIRAVAVALAGLGDATAVAALSTEATAGERTKAVITDLGVAFAAIGTKIAVAAQWVWAFVTAMGAIWAESGFLAFLKAGWTAIGIAASWAWKQMLPILTSPWTWAIVGAAALVALGIAMANTKSQAQQLVQSMNQQLAQTPISQAIWQTVTDIAQLNKSIAAARQVENSPHAPAPGFRQPYEAAAVQNAQMAIDAYEQGIQQMTASQKTLFEGMGYLTKQGYSWSQALGIMTAAGVQTSDTLQVMEQKVQNLLDGYRALGIQGSVLGNSINAITLDSELQQSQVQALTQGWSTFIGLVTGGESAFTTFAQQLQGIQQAASTTADTLTVSNGKTSASTKGAGDAAKAAMNNINGLSSADLQLSSSFTQGITDASNLINSLMTMNAAAGLGTRGTQMMTQAGQDLVKTLIPLGQGSKWATAEIFALAQQAGYHGPQSLQKLAQWADTAKSPLQNLSNIVSTFTQRAANLATDVANLSQALGSGLDTAVTGVILQFSGGNKALAAFGDAVYGSHTTTQQLLTSVGTLATSLVKVYGNTAAAKSQFEAMAIRMGIARSDADQLWTDFENGSLRSSSAVATAARIITSEIASIPSHKTIEIDTIMNAINPGGAGARVGPVAPTKHHASGTGWADAGWSWVGEAGPELVRLRGGEQILSNEQSRALVGRGSDDSAHDVRVYMDGRQIYRALQPAAVRRGRTTGTNGFAKRTR